MKKEGKGRELDATPIILQGLSSVADKCIEDVTAWGYFRNIHCGKEIWFS